eukprot:COSAG01_NODE_2489_length_7588_cov_3.099880_3_plen_45_part_00
MCKLDLEYFVGALQSRKCNQLGEEKKVLIVGAPGWQRPPHSGVM